MTRRLAAALKCAGGWRCNDKFVALAVDDYGSVRVSSAGALKRLQLRSSGPGAHMDRLDAVETKADLQCLFEVLRSVNDCDGRAAVLTAYSLAANPDFGCMREERRYDFESLPQTFIRLSATQPAAYEQTWQMWQEGMSEGLIRPQFHGREHFNVPLLEKKLQERAPDLEVNLEVESMAGLTDSPDMPGVSFTHAFGLHEISVLDRHREILQDGLRLFEEIFGFRSLTFTPPAGKLHPSLDSWAQGLGVKSVDKPFFGRQPVGNGRSQRSINFLTPPRKGRIGKVVRTLSFEPCSGVKSDPVGEALREIDIAFRWGKPAIISSHRVNYGGHIDPENRKLGLRALRELLQRIKKLWPDVRFVSVDELVEIMEADASRVQ